MKNAAARMLTGASKFHYMASFLQELHWLPIGFCVQFLGAGINLESPKQLGTEISERYLFSCALSSTGEALLSVPQVGEIHWVGLVWRAFSAVPLCLWNSFSQYAHQDALLYAFHCRAKTALFKCI